MPVGFANANFKRWLNEEVVWIISKAERERFEGLSDDPARETFIEEFWRRRDPTPATERNEYKEEHYRRLRYASQTFQEGLPGWKTDRGRIYILHGPPDAEYFFTSLSTISPLRQVPHTKRSPNTIVWAYHHNENAHYYKGEMRLVFQPSSGLSRQNFVLGESRTAQDKADQLMRQFGPAADQNWLEADVRYQLIVAGPPALINARGAELPTAGIGEAARYMDDLFRSPGDSLEEKQVELDRRERSRQELRQSVQSAVSFGSLQLDLKHQAFYRGDGQWLIPVHVNLPLDGLQEGKVDIYAAVTSRDEIVDEFLDSVEIDHTSLKESDQKQLRYFNTFLVPSGDHILRVAVREVESKQTGFREIPIQVGDQTPQDLRVSSILITNRAEVVPEGFDASVGHAILYNGARLVPNPRREFRAGEHVFLYLQVWVPEGDREISLNANFISDGQIRNRLAPRAIERSTGAVPFIEYGTAVPLADFEPGDYTLQIQVLDHTSRKFAIQRASFVVVSE